MKGILYGEKETKGKGCQISATRYVGIQLSILNSSIEQPTSKTLYQESVRMARNLWVEDA